MNAHLEIYDNEPRGRLVGTTPGPQSYPWLEGEELPRSHGDAMGMNSIYTDWDDQWIYPQLLNGWVNYGGNFASARYRRIPGGIVYIEGLVKSGSSITAPIFMLPVGYRPANRTIYSSLTSPSVGCRLNVEPAGAVFFTTGSTLWGFITCQFFASDWEYANG